MRRSQVSGGSTLTKHRETRVFKKCVCKKRVRNARFGRFHFPKHRETRCFSIFECKNPRFGKVLLVCNMFFLVMPHIPRCKKSRARLTVPCVFRIHRALKTAPGSPCLVFSGFTGPPNRARFTVPCGFRTLWAPKPRPAHRALCFPDPSGPKNRARLTVPYVFRIHWAPKPHPAPRTLGFPHPPGPRTAPGSPYLATCVLWNQWAPKPRPQKAAASGKPPAAAGRAHLWGSCQKDNHVVKRFLG